MSSWRTREYRETLKIVPGLIVQYILQNNKTEMWIHPIDIIRSGGIRPTHRGAVENVLFWPGGHTNKFKRISTRNKKVIGKIQTEYLIVLNNPVPVGGAE